MIEIGPYVAGEIPIPLTYKYETVNGDAIDLSDFTVAVFAFRADGTAENTREAVISEDPTSGEVTYEWQGGDLVADDGVPLIYTAEFWVISETNRFASEQIQWTVDPSVLDAPPALVEP